MRQTDDESCYTYTINDMNDSILDNNVLLYNFNIIGVLRSVGLDSNGYILSIARLEEGTIH